MSKAESSKYCLVSVLDKNGSNAGFGVYIGDGLVLTCAHVLQEKDDGPVLQETNVRFDALKVVCLAKVVKAVAPVLLQDGSWQSGDVALLKLTASVPNGARAAPLVAPDSLPNSWLVFGRPKNNPKLTEVNGTFKISDPLPELRGPQQEDIAIEPGFSGSPVFDDGADQVLGLVRSGIRRWEKHGKAVPVRQSYMLSVRTIVNELGSTDLDGRTSNRFVRLSTSEGRKDHHKELSKRIQREWKALSIYSTFDYRVSAVASLDAIREIHNRAVIEDYPGSQEAGAAFWLASDFLIDLTREKQRLDSAIFHLQAPGGSGKSVFARDIVQMALDLFIVPYCIDLKQSQKAADSNKQEYDLEDLFKGTVAGGSKFLKDDLNDKRLCLLIADGLNETAAAGPKWLALFRQLSENYPNLRIVICDRIVNRSSDLPNAQLLTVHPLSKQAINTEMTRANGQGLDDAKLLDLLSTPFFLHLALPSKGDGKQPAGVRGNTRTEMFEEYFRMALDVSPGGGTGSSATLRSALEVLSEIGYKAYAEDNHLFLDIALWDGGEAAEFKRKLEQAGAILAVKQADQKVGLSLRHQLLHDYLAGYYLAEHAPPDYGRLHGATWRGENPEPVNFALEIIGTAGADNFLNQVYDWNYSVTIGCLRDMEKSRRSTVSDFFKAAVAALIALKTADHFVETRRAGERDLRIFDEGLARLWRDAVTAAETTDDAKVQNLLQVVQEKFNPAPSKGSPIVDYTIWKTMFCRTNKPIRGEERFLFVDNPLIGWTAANSFRRTGFEPWFADALRGAFRALREIGVSNLDGRHIPAARVARRRIMHVLGTTHDDDTVDLLEQVVFFDAKEDDDVKNDGIRSLLEIASKKQDLRDRIVERIASDMKHLAPHLRRRILRSHRVILEDNDWRSRMFTLIDNGCQQEQDDRYRADWERAKEKLK
jgi:V8-like Glu-specific endopeptidase